MGGLTGGERASALAAHGVTRYLLEHAQAEDIPTEMGRAALRLNEEVKNLRDPANQKIEAGTTLTTVFLRNGKLFWCSIGDSHIYLYRDGTLEQLNIDHNFGAQLDQMALEGSITQDEALHHPQRAALTSYLGISELTLISGNRMPFQLRKGEILGIAGLDGSGRTEVLENLFGAMTKGGGTIKLHGKEIKNRSPRESIKNGFALLTEERRATGIFGIRDINLIKPSIGEATRVLLRRVPWKVLVHSLRDEAHLGHIYQLAREKGAELVEYPLENYRACGLIRDLADT